MKLTNPNYCATVVNIKETNKLEGCDNLIGINIFGYNVITSKETNISGPMLLFTAETQLSKAFCKENNLYSSASMNKDITKKGYIGRNGRIRAIKLRGHSSNAMLMPLSSLMAIGIKGIANLKEGDSFNELENGVEICNKYELPIIKTQGSNKVKGQTKKYERIDGKHFPEHFSTEQYLRNEHKYSQEDLLIITQKLHGTSVRLGYVKTKIKPTLFDRLLRRQRTEYDYLAGSRRVIKDLKSEKQFEHFYQANDNELDIFNKALESVKQCIPKDTILYGEIVGYTGQSPIQKGYTYGELPSHFSLYIYRIVSINADGLTTDWGWDTIKGFCKENNLKHVPELYRDRKENVDIEALLDVNYSTLPFTPVDNVIPLPKELVDEGVCIRREGLSPYVTKLKSPIFFEYETKLLDKGVEIAG